jgi:hypothetical protein
MTAQDKRVLAALVVYGAIDPLRWADNETGFDGTWDKFFRVSRLPRVLDTVYAALDRLRDANDAPWLADIEDNDPRVSAYTWACLVQGRSIPDTTSLLSGHLTESRVHELVIAEVKRRKVVKRP